MNKIAPLGRIFYHEQHGHVKIVEMDLDNDKCFVVKVEVDENYPPNRISVPYTDLLDPKLLNS